jgi:hypothetical protein
MPGKFRLRLSSVRPSTNTNLANVQIERGRLTGKLLQLLISELAVDPFAVKI